MCLNYNCTLLNHIILNVFRTVPRKHCVIDIKYNEFDQVFLMRTLVVVSILVSL